MTIITERPPDVSLTVYVGIDTHKDTHHAAIIDALGRPVADRQFPSTEVGHRALLAWIAGTGVAEKVGVEGTGSYGTTLTTFLRGAGLEVVDVDRVDRKARRFHGKSDSIDAHSAAQSVLAGRVSTIPKTHDGDVEAIRFLHNARHFSVKARAEAITMLKGAIVNAPDHIRAPLRDLPNKTLVETCARMRPGTVTPGNLDAAIKTSLRCLALQILELGTHEHTLKMQITTLVNATAPQLLDRFGIGFETAAQLLITFGDNRDRITSEGAFAALSGVSPIPASSGKTSRHRLNRGGNRQANRALHVIVMARLKHDADTRKYRDRRLAEGKSKRDIIRCLKRAVAREIYRLLKPAKPLEKST
ncbi:IS110 family transposase [Rhodococcus sp. IEGM 1330]|uniref:IS110 family transposase n=1 Tax=Rhodococcus sp. IEGM 1330 TaxID=3082225 RepID=UPI002952EB8C|nr:IS110 family transposase [Rhodococcus sp. IEGM 1330]MDV8025345.1 IS110 family transposase [Rhodococcus sp. IEGM 1330]